MTSASRPSFYNRCPGPDRFHPRNLCRVRPRSTYGSARSATSASTNNLATLWASASLVLGGTVADPELVGTVSARPGGEFRLGRNRYRIESGRMELARYPVEPPALHIVARTTVHDDYDDYDDISYDISMRVSGPVNELSTELSGFSRQNRAELLQLGRSVAPRDRPYPRPCFCRRASASRRPDGLVRGCDFGRSGRARPGQHVAVPTRDRRTRSDQG